MTTDARTDLVARLTDAVATELAARDPEEPIAWPRIPTVRAMAGHLGGVHRWVVEVLRTQRDAADVAAPHVPWAELRAWFDEGRALLVRSLIDVDPDEPCWIIGDRQGTAGFWRRRMVFENIKHLIDLRAAGDGGFRVAPELDPVDYADGIDELFAEFLSRSRSRLLPLPGPVALVADDLPRAWTVDAAWNVADGASPDAAARVTATAGDLALLVWERAEPADAARFEVSGDGDAVAALRAAPVHPWRPSV